MTPEVLRLRHRQSWEATAARCRAPLYLVGSYLENPETALDIDIIAALPVDITPLWSDKLEAQIKLSASLSRDTGLPIDFKVQSHTQFVGEAAERPVFLLAEPGVPMLDYEDGQLYCWSAEFGCIIKATPSILAAACLADPEVMELLRDSSTARAEP